MALTSAEREHVVSTAVDILSHPKRDKLLDILRRRIALGDYPDGDELGLDEIAYAVARTINDELAGDPE